VTFEQADFETFKADRKFDFIVLFEVLEHIEDDSAVLEKISGLLNDGGFLLCSVPARKRLWASSDKFAGHKRRYEKKEIIALLGEKGFKIRKICSYGFPWLNMIKIFRDIASEKQLKKLSDKTVTELTQQSGMNPIKLKLPFVGLIMNRYFWYPFIKSSQLFNDFDLAEGYLVAAEKK
jgi:trans-aconitate methyltransferase